MFQHSVAAGRARRRHAILICLALTAPPAYLAGQQGPPPLPSFLGRPVTLSPADLSAASRGDPVIQLLESPDPRVIAVFGLVAVNVPRSFFASRVGDFALSLRAAGRSQSGIFATPATPADPRSASLSPADLAALRVCKPGSCEFKLPASDMSQVRAILDKAGAAAPAEVSRYVLKRAADHVNAYREHGSAAMVTYDDFGTTGVHSGEAFAALLQGATPFLGQFSPALQEYLAAYPHKRPEGARDVIYWLREEMAGMRPTVSINHLTVYSPPDRQVTVAATKQVFADHYLEGALDVLVATTRPDAPRAEGIYLILLRQYRFDHLPGGLLGVRARVKGRMRERADADLRRLRTDYQAAWARRRPP
ncbi:MAG TPA: hypothetical protein VHE78_08465 [Gemmatimonadaceae bacterium]|nr:hypothetical protein [Gemmatimonadaceae bacterium]